MIRIDTDSYPILGQKYGLPSQKCGKSVNAVGETKKLEPKVRPHHCIRFPFARRPNEAVFQRALYTRWQCDAGF